LTYVTSRGPWYDVSWKGQPEKSGGIPTNIGIHFFDMLMWMFGRAEAARIHRSEPRRMSGYLELEHARVKWFLSVENKDVPRDLRAAGKTTFRTITVDGSEAEFSEGLTALHTRVYELTLAGRGFGLEEARPSIELVHRMRTTAVTPAAGDLHPFLQR
jgi:UDP-N-acetyl-2-amino-2-deoxyglucuronate dehydrogenase